MNGKAPNNIFVHCPEIGFKLLRAENCSDCEHNKNLLVIDEQAEDFEKKFRVLCDYPIARRLESIDL